MDTSGEERWNKTWYEGALDFYVSSPVICGDTLYVTTTNVCQDLESGCDGSKGRWGELRALDKQSGVEKWSLTPNFTSLYDCSACAWQGFDADAQPCNDFCNAVAGTEPTCTSNGTIYFGMTRDDPWAGLPGWMLWAAADANGTLLWSVSDWELETSVLV